MIMNTTIPLLPGVTNAERTGDGTIAFAAMWMPRVPETVEKLLKQLIGEPPRLEFNAIAYWILQRSVEALLRPHSLELQFVGGYFRKTHCVSAYDVSAKDKAAAIAALKEILRMLGVPVIIVAHFTADGVWAIVDGTGTGATNFGDIFLPPSELDAAAMENAKAMEQSSAYGDKLKVLMETLEKFVASQIPEPPEDPTSQS